MEPITRKELFMAKAAGQNVNVPEPITREEKYLKHMADNSVSKYFGESTEVLFDQRVEFVESTGVGMIHYMWSTADEIPISAGDELKITFNGEEYTDVAKENSLAVYFGNMSLADVNGFDDGRPFAGMLSPSFSALYWNAPSTGHLKIEKTIVNSIEPKYLPSGGAGIGYEENKVLFSALDYATVPDPNENMDAAFNIDVKDGDNLIVTWDETNYPCIARDLGTGAIFFGNIGLMGVEGFEDTGEPFLIGVMPGVGGMVMDPTAPNGHMIHIVKENIHTIDPKFLPGGGGGSGEMVVHIINNDSEPWYSADKTFAEIAEAIAAEKKVVAVTDYGEYLYLTIFSPDQMISFSSTTCYMDEGGNPHFGIQGLVITPETVNFFSENLEV